MIDVSGHRVTDALLAAMLHQAFLLGAIYELDMFGRITRRLFENLNTRFYTILGRAQIRVDDLRRDFEDARFRFLSAGQPPPAVFSNQHDRFMEVSLDLVSAGWHAAVARYDRRGGDRRARSGSRTATH